jgi:hypothetical protein
MQSIQPLLKLWRKWFNRNKLFKPDEMNELESHLLDEIDYIKEHDGLSEEQAFQKAVQLIGQRESLDQEYDKNHGFTYPRLVFWFRNHTLQLFVASLLVIVFLVADFQFSQSHTIEIKLLQTSLSQGMEPILSLDENYSFKISYTYYYGRKNKTIQWKVKQENNKPKSVPVFFCPIQFSQKEYLLVLDDQKQLWMEDSEIFTSDSLRFNLYTNTDWIYWKNFYQEKVKKQKVLIPTVNNFPDYRFGNFQEDYTFNVFAKFNNYFDFSHLPLGSSNQIMNNFIFLQSDQSKLFFNEIYLYEYFGEHYGILGGRTLINYNQPNLLIRSYKLERRPLHILPYLYQQISSRLFRRVTPQEQKQVTPE